MIENCEIKGGIYNNTCFMSIRPNMEHLLLTLQNKTMAALKYLIAMSMFKKLTENSKYSRLRRKLRKQYLEDKHAFKYSLYYLYPSLFPKKEEIEEIEQKTISVPLYSLVEIDAENYKVNELSRGKIKLNRELHEQLIPLSDDFNIDIFKKLKELFISIYINKEENSYSFFYIF